MKNKLLLLSFGLLMTTRMIYAQVPSYVPSNGLVAHYPFNSNANDESGNAHNGTAMNGAVLTTDRFGNLNNAYSFDGIDDYISANIGSLQAITVSVWINSSEPIQWYPIVAMYAQYMNFIGMRGNNPIYISNGIVGNIHTEYLPANPNYIQTNSNLSFDSWHHIVVVFDNSVSKYELYVDNILIGSAVTTGPVAPTSSTILFGNSVDGINADGGAGFKGSIDDVDIWNRALSQQEITNMYNGVNYSDTCNAVSGSLVNGLVAYYPFCGNANDQSGNGLNGVVNGATLTTDRFGNSNSAYNFNGTSNFIKVLDNDLLDLTQNLTLSAWISPNSVINEQAILGKGKTTGSTGYALLHNVLIPAKTGISIQNIPIPVSQSFINSSTLNLNTWYNLIGTYNGSQLKFYINGILVNTLSTSLQLMPNSLTDLFIGCELSGFRFFNGKIDDVGIWNRALSQQEITQLYNQNQCFTTTTVTDTLVISVGQLSYTNPVSYANNITIYPNPANTQVNISFNNITDLTGGNINIINSLGQQVATTPITLSGTNTTMPLNTWGGTGVYFVQILNAQGVVVDVKKVILQ